MTLEAVFFEFILFKIKKFIFKVKTFRKEKAFESTWQKLQRQVMHVKTVLVCN